MPRDNDRRGERHTGFFDLIEHLNWANPLQAIRFRLLFGRLFFCITSFCWFFFIFQFREDGSGNHCLARGGNHVIHNQGSLCGDSACFNDGPFRSNASLTRSWKASSFCPSRPIPTGAGAAKSVGPIPAVLGQRGERAQAEEQVVRMSYSLGAWASDVGW